MSWEQAARRLIVLGDHGLDTQLMAGRIEEPGFLTDEWLTSWYGDGTIDAPLLDALHEADERAAASPDYKALLARAAMIAEHLHAMIDRETWRAHGADDGRGHYEGDYRAETLLDEIAAWKVVAP